MSGQAVSPGAKALAPAQRRFGSWNITWDQSLLLTASFNIGIVPGPRLSDWAMIKDEGEVAEGGSPCDRMVVSLFS